MFFWSFGFEIIKSCDSTDLLKEIFDQNLHKKSVTDITYIKFDVKGQAFVKVTCFSSYKHKTRNVKVRREDIIKQKVLFYTRGTVSGDFK